MRKSPAIFSNAQLTDGFYFREIGVFAADPDYQMTAARIFFTATKTPMTRRTLFLWRLWKRWKRISPFRSLSAMPPLFPAPCHDLLILASMEDLDNHNKNKNAHEDIRQALTKKQEKITVNGLLKGDGRAASLHSSLIRSLRRIAAIC